DAIEHRVEVFCNVIPFIVRPARRNTLVQTALHDSATGHVDCLDPSYGATRDQKGGHAGHDEYQGNAPYERRLDASFEGVKVVSILAHQQVITVRKRVKRSAQHRLVER